MPSAAQLRTQIESTLARRVPSALTPGARVVRPVASTGVTAVDELLEGGLPAGAISELTGPACSGRVSLATAFVAGQTRGGQVCAWVDASDGFDAASAEASGVVLERLLWVRCGEEARTGAGTGSGAGSRFAVEAGPESSKHCIGMHPRMEEKGLAKAIAGLLAPQNGGRPGTPSAQNVALVSAMTGTLVAQKPVAEKPAGMSLHGEISRMRATTRSVAAVKTPRVEQVASDRVPARRGEHALAQKMKLNAGESGAVMARGSLAQEAAELARVAPRCAETQQGFARATQAKVTGMVPMGATEGLGNLAAMGKTQVSETRPGAPGFVGMSGFQRKSGWDRLDQAIRATDLLLQGGGFSCIVMDLSGIEAEFVNRIPMATWFRFRAAADRTRASLLVLSRHACTGSSGEVLLKMKAEAPEGTTVMTRVPLRVELMRQRFTAGVRPAQDGNLVTMRKPPRSVTEAEWRAPCASLKASGRAG